MASNKQFKLGDAVRVSTAFLRSIDPSAAKGWPTRYDPGKGMVTKVIPCGGIELIDVWFWELEQLKTYNSANLIHDRDNWDEAMRAEHAPKGI